MGVEGAVIITHARVIAADDEVGAAVILTDKGVKDGLAGARVAHGGRIHGEKHPVFRVIVFHQHFIAFHSHIGRDVISLGLADEGGGSTGRRRSQARIW